MSISSNTNSDSEQLIDELSFCVIDLETTGGNHSKDKIIEIGMVKIKARKIVGDKNFLINPETQIPDFIQKLTNISQKSVKNAPKIESVIEEVLEFIGDDIIVAHNISFDVPFLNGVLKTLNRPELSNKVICTNVMTKHLIPDILNSNLNYMSRIFNIDHTKAHRAYDDALATAKLLIIYLDIFISKGIKKVNQLYYPRNRFELDRIHMNSSQSIDEITSALEIINSSILLTIKGERGLILGVLPLETPAEEMSIVKDVLQDLDWEIITVRLIKPMIEGVFQFNNHYFKYPDATRIKILDYLNKKYPAKNEEIKPLDRYDFVLAHHLVTDQITVYSFLHFTTAAKPLFKIPAQKKKLYQYLTGQINRFEGNQKGQRKNLIHIDLIPLIERLLDYNTDMFHFLMLGRKDIKDDKDGTLKTIERFVNDDKNNTNFPTIHL